MLSRVSLPVRLWEGEGTPDLCVGVVSRRDENNGSSTFPMWMASLKGRTDELEDGVDHRSFVTQTPTNVARLLKAAE